MAGPYIRTFWTVEGKVDKDGHPIEFPTEAAAKAQASAGGIAGTGIGAGVGPVPGAAPAVRVTEVLTEDGEYVQTVDGPDGQPQEVARGVDKARLDLYKARQSAKPPADDYPKPPPTRTLPDGTMEELQKDGTWRVLGTKPQGPPAPDADAPTVRALPDGSQVQWNPTTRTWEPFAAAKPEPKEAGNLPGVNLPASRPGQRTDLSVVEAQANGYIASLNADKSLTPEERNRRLQAYIASTVQPAVERAQQEANEETARLTKRQQEADAIAKRNADLAQSREDRMTAAEERSARLAEDKFAFDKEQASYGRGRDAVGDALALLKYRVDPSVSPSIAGIYNQIIPGAFQPGAFQFDLPDLDAVAASHVGPLLDLHTSTAAPRSAAAAVPPVAPPVSAGPPQDPLAGIPVAPRVPDPNRDRWAVR